MSTKSTTYIIGTVAIAAVAFAIGRFTAPVDNIDVVAIQSSAKDRPADLADAAKSDISLSKSLDASATLDALGEKIGYGLSDADIAFLSLARRDPVAAVREAFNEKSQTSRIAKLAMALEGLNADNLPEVLALFKELPGGFESMQEYNMLMYAWGAFDAPGAVEYARESMRGRESRFASGTAIMAWAEQDPEGALAWINSQERPDGSYTFGFLRGLAGNDAQAASDYLMTLDSNDRMWGRYLDIVASEMFKQNPSKATDWALGLPEGRAQSDAFQNIAQSMSEKDPAAAAEWLREYVGQDYANGALRRVVGDLAQSNVYKALDYVNSLPEGDARNSSLGTTIREWASQDLNAAGEYLNGLPSSPETDAAVAAYSSRAFNEDPSSAIDWANSITQDGLRDDTLTNLYGRWYRSDQAAFDAYLSDNEIVLPVEQMTKITSDRGRRGGWGGDW